MKFRFRKGGYWAYLGFTKIRQLPRIFADREPKFVVDEVVRPPVGSVYAIVVCYSGFGVTEDFIELLRALKAANVNAIIISNGMPKSDALEKLRREAQRILVRRNIGRDIGAYRAATLYLSGQSLPASRVLYFNDSIMYLAGPGLDNMIRRMVETSYPVVGTFENHEFDHHIGSYAFSISGTVFHDPKLLKFWRRYKPYDLRPHAINEGEIGYSKRLKKAGYPIDVIYSINQLGEKLHAMDAAEILDLIRYMPTAWRSVFAERARKSSLGPGDRLIREFSLPARPSPPPPPPAYPVKLSALSGGQARPRVEAPAALRETRTLGDVRERMSKLALIDLVLGEISVRSQIHAGFGLYHVLMDAPLVKKDLLQRGIYVEHDCNLILSDVPDGARATVMRQLINRGRPIYFRGMRRFLIHHGLE